MKQCYSTAIRLLSKRMYTIKELDCKLAEKGFLEKDRQETQERLLAQKYLNDEAYIRAYLQYELQTHFRGKFGYWQKLMQKGIDRSLFDVVWEEFEVDEKLLAQKLLEQNSFRFENEKDPWKKKMKIQRFLAGRGFFLSSID